MLPLTPEANDLINAGFEVYGTIGCFLHCLALYRDKAVRGASIMATFGFGLWGLWNIHFYSATGNPVSAFVAGFVFLMNMTWVGMALYYTGRWKYFTNRFY